jgi:hypothetical protein
MNMNLDCEIKNSGWNQYLKKYADRYLIVRDEIGVWSIRLNQKLGCIQPYSVKKMQLVAVLSFRSRNHKTFFKKKLKNSQDFELRITQEGKDELCIVFDERNLSLVENLFKIRKRYHLSEHERRKRIEQLKKVRMNRMKWIVISSYTQLFIYIHSFIRN